MQEKKAIIHIRISEEEKKVIFEKARCAGFPSCSCYIRHVALNKKIVAISDIKSVVLLRRIGNNLNQITKKINIDSSESEILRLNADVNLLLEKIELIINEITENSIKISRKFLFKSAKAKNIN